MEENLKQLLLKDLCARLPYGVKVAFQVGNNIPDVRVFTGKDYDYLKDYHYIDDFTNCTFKPYLRPMSSMTEEEFKELKEYSGLKYEQLDLASYQNGTYKCLDFYLSEVPSYVVILVFDWLNKNHFDYRGLIEKGLALEAPKDMY